MKNLLLTPLVVSALCLMGMAAPNSSEDTTVVPPTTARGTGAMHFGDNGDGRGMLDFTIRADGDVVEARLTFGADFTHDQSSNLGTMYPDVVIKITEVDGYKFRPHRVEFWGHGFFLNEEVIVKVTAFDGDPTGQQDRFFIKTVPVHGGLDGHEADFEARGVLRTGDIVIGSD